MCASGGDYEDYPNIGGSTTADFENLNNGHQWGWHRVQIRMHQEVKNVDALKNDEVAKKTAAIYRVTVTTYFDGVAVSELYKQGRADQIFNEDGTGSNLLYTAESDGEGGIVYKDNAMLTDETANNWRTIWAFKFNYTKTASGKKAYWEEADIFYTCGHDFVQKVKPVASPDYVDYVIPDTDVHVNGAIYYEFND